MARLSEKEQAAICLYCKHPHCIGSETCYNERKREYQRNAARDRRAGEYALRAMQNLDKLK